jgi:caspase domain-containing protein/ClpA/ClpB-like protein
MENKLKRRTAYLIGIPNYDYVGISGLPIVRRDINRLRSVLEASDYQVQTHCPADGAPGISRGRLRTIITEACRMAEPQETTILYFSGHGGHFNGRDYLIPADANLSDPENIEDYLLPVDVITSAAKDCRSELILFIVDACREGMKLDAKAVALQPWGDLDHRISDNRTLVTVFACARGQVAHFYKQDDGSGYSLFTEALCQALDINHPATLLGEVLEEANKILENLVREYKKPKQEIWVLGENRATLRELQQPICYGAGPNPWTSAINMSHLWSEGYLTEDFKATVISIVDSCWSQYQATRRASPDDPWMDSRLPIRFLANLRIITNQMEGINLNPAEVALLCIAPMLREAVLARAVERILLCDPFSVEDTGSGHGIRAVLEKIHRAYPRLLRKIVRLREIDKLHDANYVALWLMHRALVREPGVWASAEQQGGLLDGPILKSLDALAQTERQFGNALSRARLLELAHCCYAAPERIERQDRPGALKAKVYCTNEFGEEFPIRERLLGYLLLIAGAMSIDPRVVSEVLVEHVGISYTPELSLLISELAEAKWEPESGGRGIKAVCTHPATDYVLVEQIEYANILLAAAHRATAYSDCSPLASLPARFYADGVKPAMLSSGPAYQTPHLRFRLAQDQVLELLMGEELYGDPSLAIRELYQNALDACRYAKARLTYLKLAGISDALDYWNGFIRFHQGVDQGGRSYIECEDNGIGMGVRELTEIFTQAGKRFADTPEFIEEQTEWLAYDVRLYPNSQFGIGVLSYFMLADDFEVETRRMDRRGQPGDGLHAAISGSGSLIRLRPGSREQFGTRVRLYLSQSEFMNYPISVVDTLAELLWIADFATEVSDAKQVLHWTPGRLGYDENHSLHSATCTTNNPDFWWRTTHGYQWPLGRDPIDLRTMMDGFVLADGIVTGSHKTRPLCIVNLREEKRPRLTVDRKSTLSWDSDWIQLVEKNEITSLLKWHTNCVIMILQLGKINLAIADHIWKAIKEQAQAIPICNAYWLLPETPSPRSVNPSKPISKELMNIEVSPMAGCFEPDLEFFAEFSKEVNMTVGIREKKALILAYQCFPPSLTLRRLKALAKGIPGLGLRSVEIALENISEFSPSPGDICLLQERDFQQLWNGSQSSWSVYSSGSWVKNEVSLEHILKAAIELEKSPAEIMEQLRAFGFSLPTQQPDWDAIGPLHKEDYELFPWPSRWDLERKKLFHDNEVSLEHILRAAIQLEKSPAEIMERLRAFGFSLPTQQPDWDAIGPLHKEDLNLIPWDLEGKEIPLADIMEVAIELRKSPAEIMERLRAFGFSLPTQQPDWDAIGPLHQEDRNLIPWDLEGKEIPLEHILRAAIELRKSPAEIMERLRAFGFSLPAQQPDWDAIGPLREEDRQLLPWKWVYNWSSRFKWERQAIDLRQNSRLSFKRRRPDVMKFEYLWPKNTASYEYIIRAAIELRKSPAEIMERLRAFGFSLPTQQPDWDAIGPLHQEDLIIISNQLDGRDPLIENEVSLEHILRAAIQLEKSPAEIMERLRAFGFSLPTQQPDWDVNVPLHKEDYELFPWSLLIDGKWVKNEVSLGHILKAAIELEKSPAEIMEQLRAFGFSLPTQQPDWDAIGPLHQEDRNLIPWDLEGKEIPLKDIMEVAARFNKNPLEIISRLVKLGYEIQLGTFPYELELVIQIFEGCTREEARQRLLSIGLTLSK